MEATSSETWEGIGDLRRWMVASARRAGVRHEDAEDVAHEALAKLFRETPSSDAPPIQIRAFASLRDKRIEYMRARSREATRRIGAPIAGQAGDKETIELETTDAGLALVEACELVTRIAGHDAMCFAFLKGMGATERDVADLMGWSTQRVASTRIRLARKKSAIARALAGRLKEGTW